MRNSVDGIFVWIDYLRKACRRRNYNFWEKLIVHGAENILKK